MTLLHQHLNAKDVIFLFNMHTMIDFCLLLFLKHLCLLKREFCTLLVKPDDANTLVSEPPPEII